MCLPEYESKGLNIRCKISLRGVATGVARGVECHPWQKKIAKNREKSGKIGKKSGKNGKKREKSGRKGKNREEKAKIRKFLSLCPSWQIGLATLLAKWGHPPWWRHSVWGLKNGPKNWRSFSVEIYSFHAKICNFWLFLCKIQEPGKKRGHLVQAFGRLRTS